MRVTFPKVSTSPDPNVRGVIVAVDVNEGPVYKLGNIRVTGLAGRESELVKLIDLKPGAVIDFDQIKNGAQRMEHNLRREGYLKVASDYARTFNDTAKTVDVVVKVDPGPQFKFTQLNVVGLDIETEPVIRKMWGLQAGKPYNIDYPEHFLARVKEDGVFDGLKNSRFESKIDPDSYEVEVTLYFNEKIKPPDNSARPSQGSSAVILPQRRRIKYHSRNADEGARGGPLAPAARVGGNAIQRQPSALQTSQSRPRDHCSW